MQFEIIFINFPKDRLNLIFEKFSYEGSDKPYFLMKYYIFSFFIPWV